jgi:hypothetical protein
MLRVWDFFFLEDVLIAPFVARNVTINIVTIPPISLKSDFSCDHVKPQPVFLLQNAQAAGHVRKLVWPSTIRLLQLQKMRQKPPEELARLRRRRGIRGLVATVSAAVSSP